MPKVEKSQIQAMRELGFSDEEIADVIACDERIDKGEKLFELNAEQKQAQKKMRQAERKSTVYNFSKRERKADNVKAGLIELITEVIKEQPACNSLEVINAEREFVFFWMGTKYKIVLSAPRT